MPESEAATVIRWERGADGVVTLTLDQQGPSAETERRGFKDSLTAVVDRLEAERETITGVIVTSAAESFFAGGELELVLTARPEDAQEVFEASLRIKRDLRRLETLGRPVVAAINGTALGGGFEIALACHHRVALGRPGYLLGLPEASLGLLPAGGGTTRTVRMLGLADALVKVLLNGTQFTPAHAERVGLVHRVVDTEEELLAEARAFIAANPEARQPWDTPGYAIPGGTPASPELAAVLPAFAPSLAKETGGAPYPAPRNILAAAVEGAQVDFDTAQTVESRYFVELATGQNAKNMIQAFYFDLGAVNSGLSRPEDLPARTVRRAAVLGAGMMGAGIAYVCAKAGIEVVLKDVTAEAAEEGKRHSALIADKALARATEAERAELLARITPTGDPADVAGCDAVIEAVYEDPALKHRVFQEIEPLVAPDALLCSNTSSLPITGLAAGVTREADFVGLHFFSPVDKMPLVEIIKGEKTGDEALARAFDLSRQIGKTPIVVNDSRGFFTSRLIGHFFHEGVAMVGEGIEPASIEQAAAQAGFPAKVLALVDDLTLTLPRMAREATQKALAAEGLEFPDHPAHAIMDRMIDEFGRKGRPWGAGFYDYGEKGERQRLWPGLREHFTRTGADAPDVSFLEMQERMLFCQSLDAIRLLEEGVVTSVADANIGSIMGIGFPAWTGGVIQYVNGYAAGPAGFAARARELHARYGTRFALPELLERKAAAGEPFRD